MKQQSLPFLVILLSCVLSLQLATAELTEEDIIAKELAWAKKAVKHYQHGFQEEHPLIWNTDDTDNYESYLAMPKHEPMIVDDEDDDDDSEDVYLVIERSNLRGGP
jgi:hypothetical protein